MIVTKELEKALTYPGVKDCHINVGFHPSSASIEFEDGGVVRREGACLRQQFYQYASVPRTNPPGIDTLYKFALGNITHEMVVELIKQAGSYAGDEVRMFNPGPPPISGRPDLFIKDPRDNSPIGVEIKSIYGYYSETEIIKKDGARPKLDHVLQCLPYLDFYGQFGLTRWILLYISRGTGETAEYIVMLEDDGSAMVQGKDYAEIIKHATIHNIKKRWLVLQDHINNGTLPPRDYELQWSNEEIVRKFDANELTKTDSKKVDKALSNPKQEGPLLKKGDWRCAYCDWKDRCYSPEPFPQGCVPTKLTTPVEISQEQKAKKMPKQVVDGGIW